MAGNKNPLGTDGKPLECSICSSDEHLGAFCPKKKKFGGGKGRGKKSGFQASSSSPFLAIIA